MRQAFICDAVRTPIGRYGGALASIRTDDLAALPLTALMQRNPKTDWPRVDDVFMGCANQAGEDNRNVARMALLLAGMDKQVPGTTINRLCGSGMDAVGSAARAIKSGETELMIAGGVESMSRAPYVMGKSDSPYGRNPEFHDSTMAWRFINPKMDKLYGTDPMGMTAENVAEQFNVSREDQDQFAFNSQQKVASAWQHHRFDEEIIEVAVPRRKKEDLIINKDEHPRIDTGLDALAKLKTIFKDNGSVTAGNAAGINDGACALVLASEQAATENHLNPITRVVSMATVGVEPRIMGIGPGPAVQALLAKNGLSVDDIDVFELNEAFAAQALASARMLGLDDNDPRLNPNGGSIALGHPLGMSGARLITTASYELRRRKGKYAVCAMCIGVGQGIATLIEKL